MDRRRFLELALTLSATGGIGLLGGGLAGCGGGKSTFVTPNGNGETRQVQGIVVVPAGFTLPLTQLKAATGFGSAVVGENGAFVATVSAQGDIGPTFAWVQDQTGENALLMGFGGENGGGTLTLSATSTAVALVYFALGGFSLVPKDRSTLLQLIAADASLPSLVQTVEQQIAANPLALMQNNAAIGNALKTVLAALGASAGRAQQSRSQIATRSRDEGIDAQTLISPTGLQSNAEIVQATSAQSIIATNHSRRYCRVYTYETGFQDSEGVRTDYPAAKVAVGPTKLSSTAALSVLSTIGGFMSGQTAFVPVSTPQITLNAKADASRTFFDAIVLGSSALFSEPGFFSDPKYAAFVDDWRSARATMNIMSWVGDVLLGLLFEIWGLQGLSKSEAAVESAVAKFARAENVGPNIAFFITAAGEGRFADATRAFLAAMGSSADIMLRIRAILSSVFTEMAGFAVVEAEANAAARLILRMLETAMNAASVLIGLGDLGAVLYDLANANQGDLWNVTLFKPTVRINPSAQQLTQGEELALTASIPGNTGGNFSYIWTLSGSDLASLRGDGNVGKTIETTSPTVTLATTPSTVGTLTVKVEVSQKSGAQSTFIGDATSTITMTNASNARNIVTESYLYDTEGGHGYVVGYLSFPLSSTPVYAYRITTSSDAFGDNQTFEIRADDLGQPVPDSIPLDTSDKKLPVYNLGNNQNFLFLFYHRGNNIYLRYQSNPYSVGISGSKEHAEEFLTSIGEKFHDLKFEVIPFQSH